METKSNQKRNRKITVRFTFEEYDAISSRAKSTTFRKLSEFVRAVMLNQPITVFTRNESADEYLRLMLEIKSELNAVGNNYNQVVKKMHQLSRVMDLNNWFEIHEATKKSFDDCFTELFKLSQQIYEKWSQE